jgi:hypothetical protein
MICVYFSRRLKSLKGKQTDGSLCTKMPLPVCIDIFQAEHEWTAPVETSVKLDGLPYMVCSIGRLYILNYPCCGTALCKGKPSAWKTDTWLFSSDAAIGTCPAMWPPHIRCIKRAAAFQAHSLAEEDRLRCQRLVTIATADLFIGLGFMWNVRVMKCLSAYRNLQTKT